MNLVLDASAGVVLAATEGYRALRERVAEAVRVGAPALYDYEVTNAVWKYHRFGGWEESQCTTVLTRALALVDERVLGDDLAIESLALARKHAHPSYDLFYVVLARRHDALLATADEKLLRLAKRLGARVETHLLRP